MNVQVPPNLSPTMLRRLIAAGINDWGGVSPVTPDHVNPERPWPALDVLRGATERAGRTLAPRLTVACSLTKGHKPELAVQKLTELGMDEIVPFGQLSMSMSRQKNRVVCGMIFEAWRNAS